MGGREISGLNEIKEINEFKELNEISDSGIIQILLFLFVLFVLSVHPVSLVPLVSLPPPRLNSFCVSAYRLRCLYPLGKRSKWPVADKKDWCVRIFKLFFVSLRGYCIY